MASRTRALRGPYSRLSTTSMERPVVIGHAGCPGEDDGNDQRDDQYPLLDGPVQVVGEPAQKQGIDEQAEREGCGEDEELAHYSSSPRSTSNSIGATVFWTPSSFAILSFICGCCICTTGHASRHREQYI